MSEFDDKLREMKEVGYVEEVMQSVILVSGLPGVRVGEVLLFESGERGKVSSLREHRLEVLVFSRNQVRVGERVARTGKFLTVMVGEGMLGRILDAQGHVIEGGEWGGGKFEYLVDIVPAGIHLRKKISRPLETGVAMLDLVVPLGHGQRELVMGDRKTGKSQVILQTMLTQARLGTVCIYAAIGQRRAEILRVAEFARANKVDGNVIVVAASSQDSPAEIFEVPYTAMTIGEYFRDQGRNVLLVLDDMSTHAKFYREVSLLSRKFPGRDSYPGDIFNIHARLLERAGNFLIGNKEVSISVLPVVETIQGDITGYIQTNLMSMTDGHIYFDVELYKRGRRPAISPFLSVTRVGHQTQTKVRQEIGREIISLLSEYEKTQSFLRFGAELGESSRQILSMGEKILTFFEQPYLSVIPMDLQVVLVGWVWTGVWNGKNLDKILTWYNANADKRMELSKMVGECQNFAQLIGKSRDKAEMLAGVGL